MAKQRISEFRLILNGVACVAIVIFCLPLAFMLAIDLASMSLPLPDDPDGPKALGLTVFGIGFCGFFGSFALIDLLRTVKRLRELTHE